MAEIHSSFRTNITLYSNNPYIRMTWVCNGELDGTMPRTAMRFYYQINSSGYKKEKKLNIELNNNEFIKSTFSMIIPEQS